MKTLKPIRTERDYRAALRDLGAFFDRNPDTAAKTSRTIMKFWRNWYTATKPNTILFCRAAYADFARLNFQLCYFCKNQFWLVLRNQRINKNNV